MGSRSVERSLLFFASYLLGLGLIFILVPNLLLEIFGLATDSPLVRVLGYVLLVLAYYYWRAVQLDLQAFYRWTVHARAGVLPFFLVMVAFELAPPIVIAFGVFEAGCTLWTHLAIRQRVAQVAKAPSPN